MSLHSERKAGNVAKKMLVLGQVKYTVWLLGKYRKICYPFRLQLYGSDSLDDSVTNLLPSTDTYPAVPIV